MILTVFPTISYNIILLVVIRSQTFAQDSRRQCITRNQILQTFAIMCLRISILVLYLCTVNSLNILGIFPHEGKSHFTVYEVYLKELSRRGHNLTVISYFPNTNQSKNYKDISLPVESRYIIENSFDVKTSYIETFKMGLFLLWNGKNTCEILLANKEVQRIVNDKHTKFDVVIVEQFTTDCGLGIAHKLDAPVVGITSFSLMAYHHQRTGMPLHPAYVSSMYLDGGTKPTFYQRIERVIFDSYFTTIRLLIQDHNQRLFSNYFGRIPSLEDLARNINVFLLYTNKVLTQTRLLPSNIIEVGGYHVCKSSPLTNDLKKFVEDAEHGVVYISFGSIVRSSGMSKDKLDAVLGAIKELPQRFVWKWDDDTLAIKDKLYISNWLPQNDILAHNNTVAFITHGGMASSTESIHYGVPAVALPILGDQPFNAAAIEESGMGINLAFNDLTKVNLVGALKKIFQPTFRDQVKRLSAAWHDRPMSPLDTAIYWTEYTARHPNISQGCASSRIPFYQHMCFDIILFFLIVFSLVGYILTILITKFISLFFKVESSKVKKFKEN